MVQKERFEKSCRSSRNVLYHTARYFKGICLSKTCRLAVIKRMGFPLSPMFKNKNTGLFWFNTSTHAPFLKESSCSKQGRFWEVVLVLMFKTTTVKNHFLNELWCLKIKPTRKNVVNKFTLIPIFSMPLLNLVRSTFQHLQVTKG